MKKLSSDRKKEPRKPQAEILPFPTPPPPLPLQQWGETYREAIAAGHKPIGFPMNLEPRLVRSLLIEATATGKDVYDIAATMITLGIKFFHEEGLLWCESETPGNVVPFLAHVEYEIGWDESPPAS